MSSNILKILLSIILPVFLLLKLNCSSGISNDDYFAISNMRH